MVNVRLLALGLLFAAPLLSGCLGPLVAKEPVEVLIPVPVRAKPPVELNSTFHVDHLPVFIAPGEPAASSALDAEGERRLKEMLIKMKTRIRSWEGWGIHE